jgi:hypothetical protein
MYHVTDVKIYYKQDNDRGNKGTMYLEQIKVNPMFNLDSENGILQSLDLIADKIVSLKLANRDDDVMLAVQSVDPCYRGILLSAIANILNTIHV